MEPNGYLDKFEQYRELFSSRKINLSALLQEQLQSQASLQNAADLISGFSHSLLNCFFGKAGSVRPSAFRATAAEDVTVTGRTKVNYPNVGR